MAKQLTAKQSGFLDDYLNHPEFKGNASACYRNNYDCSRMKEATINNSAYKNLKIPEIAARIEKVKEKIEKKIEEEFIYTALEHYNELEELKQMALGIAGENKDDKSNAVFKPDYKTALQATVKKGELQGLYKIKTEISGDLSKMPFEVKVVE